MRKKNLWQQLPVMGLLVLVSASSFSQSRAVDSLRQLLAHANNDSSRLHYHNLIARQFLREELTDSQGVHADAVIQLSELGFHAPGMLSDIASGYRLKGIYYRLNGALEKAIPYYIHAINLFESIPDSNGLASTLNSIGIAYLNLKRYDEAFDYFSQARDIDRALRLYDKESADLQNMMNALRRDGIVSDSVKGEVLMLADRALSIIDSIDGTDEAKARAHEAVAIALRDLGDYQSALKHQLTALHIADTLRQPNLLAEQLYICAELYISLNEPAVAIEYGLKAERIAGENKNSPALLIIYDILSRGYAAQGDFKRAYTYSEQYQIMLDSTYQTEIAEQLKRFESQQKDDEIKLLSNSNEIKEKENQATLAKLQRNRIVVVAIAILLTLLSILTWLIYRNRHEKIRNIRNLEQLNNQLRKQKDEIADMNAVLALRALRAQMNPHFIFNCMSSIQECILMGEIDDADKYLTKLSRLLRMVLEYAEREMISLDKELEMLDLYLQLESVRMKENFRFSIAVDEKIFPEEISVPALILQPFAENAIWHGLRPKKTDRCLHVIISQTREQLSCIIEDNGVGRAVSSVAQQKKIRHESKGIRIVQDRLSILNQKLTHARATYNISDMMTDGVASGTRVELLLPLTGSHLLA